MDIFFFIDIEVGSRDIGPTDGDRIWNVDESGLTVVHKPGRIVAKKGQKQAEKERVAKKGKTVTVVCSINASECCLAFEEPTRGRK